MNEKAGEMAGTSWWERAAAPAPSYCPHLQENIYLKTIMRQGLMWYSTDYSRTPSPSYSKAYAHPGNNGGIWKTSPSPVVTQASGNNGGIWKNSPSPVVTQASGNNGGIWKNSPSPVVTQGSGNNGGIWKNSPSPVVTQGSGNNGGIWKTSSSPVVGQSFSPIEDPYKQKVLGPSKYGQCRQEAVECSQNQLKPTQTSQFHRWPLEQAPNAQQPTPYPHQFHQERFLHPSHFQQQPRHCIPRPPAVHQPMERMPLPVQAKERMTLPVQTTERMPLPVQTTERMPLPVQTTERMPLPVQATERMPLPVQATERMPLPVQATERMPLPVQTTERMPLPVQTTERKPRAPEFQEQQEQASFAAHLQQQQQQQQFAPRPRLQHQHGHLEPQRELPSCQQQYQQQQLLAQGKTVSQQQQQLQQPPQQQQLQPLQQQQQQCQPLQQLQQLQPLPQQLQQQQQLQPLQQQLQQQQQLQPLQQQLQQQQQMQPLQPQQQLQPLHQQQQQQLKTPQQQQQQLQQQQRQQLQSLHQQQQQQQQLQPLQQQQQLQPQQQQLQQQQQQLQPQQQQLQPQQQQLQPQQQQLQPLQQQLQPLQQQLQPQQQQLQPLQQQQLLQPPHQQPLQPTHPQQKSCILQDLPPHAGQTQQLLRPSEPAGRCNSSGAEQCSGDQRPHGLVYNPPRHTHQAKRSEGSQERQQLCHQLHSKENELYRESCQYKAGSQRGQFLHTGNDRIQETPQSQQLEPDPSRPQQQPAAKDQRRPSLIVYPKPQGTTLRHDLQGNKTRDELHQKTTGGSQRPTHESHQKVTDESQGNAHSGEQSQQTKLNKSEVGKKPKDLKLRRQRLGLKYRLGKFARLLGPDSPPRDSTSPEPLKQSKYTTSCMYSTNSSASGDINPLDTSVNSFINMEVMSPQRDNFSTGKSAEECACSLPKAGDVGSQSPNDIFYSCCSVPTTSQRCTSMACPPVTRLTDPEGVVLNPRVSDPEGVVLNSRVSEPEGVVLNPRVSEPEGVVLNPRVSELEGVVLNPRVSEPEGVVLNSRDSEPDGVVLRDSSTLSLTPPPTPPVTIPSPQVRSEASDPVPCRMTGKVTPVCEILAGDYEDIKPVTFTKSFLEAMPALPGHTLFAPEPASRASEHTPEATTSSQPTTSQSGLPVDQGLSPDVPQFSPHRPAPEDEPEVIVLSSETPNIPQISPDLPEPTGTAEATSRNLKPKSTTSAVIQPATSTAQVETFQPQASSTGVVTCQPGQPSSRNQGRLPTTSSIQGSSRYKFFRNLCIQARFSMYIPPHLEFPCLMCNTSVAGEEALYHLFFGQIQCAVCGVLVSTCRDFKTLENFNTDCGKDKRGEHDLLMWSLDPIDFVSYHIRRGLVMRDSCGAPDTSPSTTDVVDEIAKFLEKFSVLKQHSPWAQAIRRCWKYVRNMQSTSDLTPRLKQKRKQSFNGTREDIVDLSPNSKAKSLEDGAEEVTDRPGVCKVKENFKLLSCQEREADGDSREQTPKRRKEADENNVSTVAEDEETSSSSSSERWFTTESLRYHLERKVSLYEACNGTPRSSQDTCVVTSVRQTPSNVSLTAKELAIARSARFPESVAPLESPEVESEFGDFLLSLPYNHDMLDQIIQYVSVADDKIRRPTSPREENISEIKVNDAAFPEATGTTEDDGLIECPAITEESQVMADTRHNTSRVAENCSEPEVVTAEEGLFVIKETFSLKTPPHTECSPERRKYKPMPKSKRKLLDLTDSGPSPSPEPPPLTPPDPRWSFAGTPEKDFIVYWYPSCQCPEECPMCYEVLCPSQFVLNTVTFVASTYCRGCGLTLYIVQDSLSDSSSAGARKPGPKSKTKTLITSEEMT